MLNRLECKVHVQILFPLPENFTGVAKLLRSGLKWCLRNRLNKRTAWYPLICPRGAASAPPPISVPENIIKKDWPLSWKYWWMAWVIRFLILIFNEFIISVFFSIVDPGLCTTNKERFLNFHEMNILDNSKILLFLFNTYSVRRPL